MKKSAEIRRNTQAKTPSKTLLGLTEFVENFQIPIPTYHEQTQIASFLDRETEQIDELIATEQRKTELLKECRQSLISEAVTGKIDVRNEV